ncbi:SBBP repeat-containing protein [Hymenobacter sp. 15J16-1T3B]|uniref:SBBP repeat-containing protein n=1 Tax=Hymenobacter sp. 15J16-1T3B TaxID=2886941 RepID=UPI001D12D442|nr:SBBP repeat-containing protein [Hymenobacter sp. 15J16-1T3B]MCC3160840.1 SBBP repeat-containing protein [Hymenobacter sp. 15J16-1T3B]
MKAIRTRCLLLVGMLLFLWSGAQAQPGHRTPAAGRAAYPPPAALQRLFPTLTAYPPPRQLLPDHSRPTTPLAAASCQAAASPAWVSYYNGPANSYDFGGAVALGPSGDVYVTGSSANPGNGYSDFATIKYDRQTGRQLWVARYNGPADSDDQVRGIAVDARGDVYVTGYSMTSTFFIADYATIKYDGRTGRQLWVAYYDGPAGFDDQPAAIALDPSGNVYVTGSTSNGDFYDYATVKYNGRTGQQLWATVYDSPYSLGDFASSVAVGLSGDVYVTGTSAKDASDGLFDIVTLKYDGRTGQPLWESRYDGPNNQEDHAGALVVDVRGDVYLTGSATLKYNGRTGQQLWVAASAGWDGRLALRQLNGLYLTGSSYNGSNADYVTLKLDPRTGQELWRTYYDGGYDDAATGIDVDGPGNVYVTGTSFTSSDEDIVTLVYDGNTGQEQWRARYNGPASNADRAGAVVVDPAGNVYVGGSASVGGPFQFDYVTLKYAPIPNCPRVAAPAARSAASPLAAPLALEAFPNPTGADAQLRCYLPQAGPAELRVYNQLGRLVGTQTLPPDAPAGWHTLPLPTATLGSGLYTCQLRHHGQAAQLRLLVQH